MAHFLPGLLITGAENQHFIYEFDFFMLNRDTALMVN
jgi:hypothetical protein